MLKLIFAVLYKELKSEFRTKYAISAVMLFVLTTVTMVAFSTAGEKINESIASGIIWIIMFFGAMTGLSKSFVSEEERGTYLMLQITSNPTAIYFGKLIFNILLSLALNFFGVFLFFIFITSVDIANYLTFFIIIFTGSIAIAGATTIISALIAKASSKNALFPVLSFPILLPIIILGIIVTNQSFLGVDISKSKNDIQMIIAYTGIMITASYFLFDFVWRE
jgi:heme exporter protein B